MTPFTSETGRVAILDRPDIDKKKKWNWYIAGAKGIVSQ